MKRGYIFSGLIVLAAAGGFALWTVRAVAQNAPAPIAAQNAPAPIAQTAPTQTAPAAPAPVAATSVPAPVAASATEAVSIADAPSARPTDEDIGEGFARPTFRELVQTRVLLNGYDILNPKVADDYGRIVYCKLYNENFGNDVVWNKIRNQIVSRVQKKTEPYRIRYEIIVPFQLGRYDFKNQFFPIQSDATLQNVGSISLSPLDSDPSECKDAQKRVIFPDEVSVRLATPLTVKGFHVPINKVEKMMVRLEEAGNANRSIYGRIRFVIKDVPPPADFRRDVLSFMNGDVESVVFFLDKDLTKPIGRLQFGRR